MSAPAEPIRPSGPAHLAYVDSLRGLAALYVALCHTFQTQFWNHPAVFAAHAWAMWLYSVCNFGRAAVDVFLVISGFVLFLPIDSGRRAAEPYHRFMLRRAWRILPPYYAALALSVAYAAREGPIHLDSLAAHLLVIHNLISMRTYSDFNLPLWSIATEFQLYMVFPLLVLFWKRVGPARVLGAAIALTIASRFLTYHLPHHFVFTTMFVHSVPGFLAVFAFGLFAAHATVRGRWLTAARPLLALSAAGGALGVWLALHAGFAILGDTLWGAAALCLLLACRTAGRWLSARPLVTLGRFSYSLYLTHQVTIFLIDRLLPSLESQPAVRLGLFLLMDLPAMVGLAYGFHCLFERRFLTPPAWLRAPERRRPADEALHTA